MKGMSRMYDIDETYPCPYYAPMDYANNWGRECARFPCPYNPFRAGMNYFIELRDYGPEPFVVNINEAAKQNNNYRTALWTGRHLQLTLMSINVGDDIGLEVHPHLDQFIRIEEGQGVVQMGDRKNCLDFQQDVCDDFAIFIPAGKWHNVTNTGNKPIKLYSIYAPPQHPFGTVQAVKPYKNHDHKD